jgi:hypothetical protein
VAYMTASLGHFAAESGDRSTKRVKAVHGVATSRRRP